MSIRAIAVVKKESKIDSQKPQNRVFYASLRLLREDGAEYGGGPRYFSGYEEVGDLLRREAAVAHEHLQDHRPLYDQGKEVRIHLILECDEVVGHLGFRSQT